MAIIVKHKNPIKLIQAFGCSEPIYNEFCKMGGSLKTTTGSIQFIFEGLVIQSVSVKAGALSMATSGTLGSASKEALKYKIKKALSEALIYSKKHGSPKIQNIDFGNEVVVGGTTFKGMSAPTGFLPNQVAALSSNSEIKSILAQHKISLSKATKLYQPVGSTSGDSVYHVVGLSKDLKIAARYKQTMLSIRVEGVIHANIKSLKIAGFSDDHANEGYVSIHLDVGSVLMAKRTMGAILSGIDNLLTPMPDLNIIYNKN